MSPASGLPPVRPVALLEFKPSAPEIDMAWEVFPGVLLDGNVMGCSDASGERMEKGCFGTHGTKHVY